MNKTRNKSITILLLVFITCLFGLLLSSNMKSQSFADATDDAPANTFDATELQVVGYDIFYEYITPGHVTMESNINNCTMTMTNAGMVTVTTDLENQYHGNYYYGKLTLYKWVTGEGYVLVGDVSSVFGTGVGYEYDIGAIGTKILSTAQNILDYIESEDITGNETFRICFLYTYSTYANRMTDGPLEDYQMSGDYIDFKIRTTQRYALPTAPEREGYNFVGWYSDSELTIPYTDSYIYADTNLYAKYDIIQLTVTFKYDDQTVTKAVNYGSVLTASDIPAPTKTGYTITGWYYEDNITKYELQLITSNITLTAQWGICYYNVNFYINNTLFKTVSVPYGTRLVNTIQDLNLDTYNLSSVDTGVTTQDEQLVVVNETNVNMAEPNILQKTTKWFKTTGYTVWDFLCKYWIDIICVNVTLASLIALTIVLIKKRG